MVICCTCLLIYSIYYLPFTQPVLKFKLQQLNKWKWGSGSVTVYNQLHCSSSSVFQMEIHKTQVVVPLSECCLYCKDWVSELTPEYQQNRWFTQLSFWIIIMMTRYLNIHSPSTDFSCLSYNFSTKHNTCNLSVNKTPSSPLSSSHTFACNYYYTIFHSH